MTEVKRLKYTDSSGTEQVLGALKTPPDQVPDSPDATAKIKNIKVSRVPTGFSTAKIWATSQLYGELPVGASNFNTSEPEIFLQYYDRSSGSWVDEMRLYAENQGGINSDGEVAVKLYTHGKRTGRENAEKSTATTTNIVDAFNDVLPAGYTAVAPAEADIDGNYPIVEDYTLTTKRRTGYRELTKPHNWFYEFTAGTDGSGNYEVTLAPRGWKGPVNTIQGRTDVTEGNVVAKKIKEWEKGRTKDIVNKVEVVGKNANGEKVTGTASDQTSIDNYGERFEREKIDYRLGSATEAENIAADKLELSPGEGGEIKTNVFIESVLGKTFNVLDSIRDIDGEFTVTEQVNYYPENNTELTFTYDSEIERRADKDSNVDRERSKIYPDTSTTVDTKLAAPDVTGESGSDSANVSGNAGTNNANVSGFSGGNDPEVEGETDRDASTNVIEQTGFSEGLSAYSYGSGFETLGGSFSTEGEDIQGAVAVISLTSQPQGTPTEEGDLDLAEWNVRVVNTDQNIEIPSSNGINFDWYHYAPTASFYPADNKVFSIFIPGNHAFDDLEVQYEAFGSVGESFSTDVGGSVSWYTIDQHTHAAATGVGTLQSANHGHDANTYDADDHEHDEGTLGADDHPHGDGSYQSADHDHGSSDVNTATEDDTSR